MIQKVNMTNIHVYHNVELKEYVRAHKLKMH